MGLVNKKLTSVAQASSVTWASKLDINFDNRDVIHQAPHVAQRGVQSQRIVYCQKALLVIFHPRYPTSGSPIE